jgi:hypothetical protein
VKVTIDDNSRSVDIEFSPVRQPRAGQSLED